MFWTWNLDVSYLFDVASTAIVEPTWSIAWSYFLAIFTFVQVFVLILQEHLGPAFFLPKRVLSPILTFLPHFSWQTIVRQGANIWLPSTDASSRPWVARTISRRLCYLHGRDRSWYLPSASLQVVWGERWNWPQSRPNDRRRGSVECCTDGSGCEWDKKNL